jgi:hypothetical protein
MDAVTLLKDDRKNQIAEEAMHELAIHAEFEEEIFYRPPGSRRIRKGRRLLPRRSRSTMSSRG